MKAKYSIGVHEVEFFTSTPADFTDQAGKTTRLYKVSMYAPSVSEDVETVYLTQDVKLRTKMKVEILLTGKEKGQLKISVKFVEEKK